MTKKDYVYFNAYIKKQFLNHQVCEDNVEYKIETPNNMHDKLKNITVVLSLKTMKTVKQMLCIN